VASDTIPAEATVMEELSGLPLRPDEAWARAILVSTQDRFLNQPAAWEVFQQPFSRENVQR
jgi:hypothetical protein